MSNIPSCADLVFELSPNIIIFVDPQDIIRKINKQARQFFRVKTSEDAEGKYIFDVVENPVLVLLIKKWFEKLNKRMEVDEIVPLDRLRNDQYEWFHIRAFNVDHEGQLMGKTFFISDVTELYSQKKILDTLMSSIPGDVLVFDRTLNLLLVSDAVARANGFHSWRDVAGRSLHDLSKFDLKSVEFMLEKIILYDEPMHQIVKYTRANNETRWYYVDVRTIKSTAGTFGYILTQFDITGEIKPKAILEALMDSASDAIAIVSPEGILEYASRSLVKTLGFDNWRLLINHPWKYLFRNSPSATDKYAQIFADDQLHSKKGTISLDNPDGKIFFNYRIDPLDYQNENFGLLAIASNTTELVAACDRAEAAVRAKAAFLANMSHELRTPMNAVLGMNELLSRTALTALQKNYSSHIRSSATLLLSIINDILDFSRIEDRKLELAESPYDVNSLLHDVINLVAVKITEKELSFTVDLDPALPKILIGDEIRVKQILINLLNNAVKFTDEGLINLAVDVSCSDAPQVIQVSFKIKDTGIGIPKNRQDEMFERFTRIENAHNASVEGSGLGLSICKGLVRMMGGSLALESEEGKGSVFTAEITQRLPAKSEPIAIFSHSGKISLLVFDQDPANIASIRQMAERASVAADFCSSYNEFSARLSADTFAYTHVIFEYKSAYTNAVDAAHWHPTVKWLALLTMTDFIGKGKDPAIDFIFKPLVVSVFARFLQGEHVDFSVSLPLASSFGTYFFRASGVRILVVDDSAVNRKVAEGFLQTLDIQVDEAECGSEAIEKAAHTKYDLVLMDHMMPGMDGIEAASRIRALPEYQSTPIIALTANAGNAYTDQYIKAGMNDYLCKPIEFNAFIACLKKWLPAEKRTDIAENTVAAREANGQSGEPPAARASAKTEEWIPGLDKESGISFTGSVKNLEMVLKIFNRAGPKMLEQLEAGHRSANPGQLRIAVHSLISSCANIGGKFISEQARELEQAILSGNADEIERLYPAVHDELEKLIEDVVLHTKKQQGA